MSEERKDKLGRKIPVFDRSASGKKSFETRRKKHGADNHKRAVSAGGSKRTRGYFGKLKDEGNDEEIKRLSKIGNAKSQEVNKKRTRKVQDSPRGIKPKPGGE